MERCCRTDSVGNVSEVTALPAFRSRLDPPIPTAPLSSVPCPCDAQLTLPFGMTLCNHCLEASEQTLSFARLAITNFQLTLLKSQLPSESDFQSCDSGFKARDNPDPAAGLSSVTIACLTSLPVPSSLNLILRCSKHTHSRILRRKIVTKRHNLTSTGSRYTLRHAVARH